MSSCSVSILIDLGSINPEVPTGNSHNSNNTNAVNNKVGNGEPKKPPPQASARKEKSVLQAKLTRLAIQIGYGGNTMYSILAYICMYLVYTYDLLRAYIFKGVRNNLNIRKRRCGMRVATVQPSAIANLILHNNL